MQTQPHELAANLELLLTDFRFVAGYPARRSNEVVDVSVHCDRTEEGRQQHLFTVFAGFPPPPIVRGLWWTIRQASNGHIACIGQTDNRGQFRVWDLEASDYILEIDAVKPVVWPPSELVSRWRARTQPGESTEPPERRVAILPREGLVEPHCFTAQPEANRGLSSGELFRCKSEAGTTCLRLTATGDMVIQAEFRSDLIADRLAHVRVWNEENRLLAEGYMGLYPINDGQAFLGESRLDVLAPDLREMISRGCLCYFGVAPQVGSRLIARDRQTLEKSLLAAVQPASRKVLKELLGTSPERWREQSTFATEP